MDSGSFSSGQSVEDVTLGSLKTPFMQNRKYFCLCAIGLKDNHYHYFGSIH